MLTSQGESGRDYVDDDVGAASTSRKAVILEEITLSVPFPMKRVTVLVAASVALAMSACTSSDDADDVQAVAGTGVPCSRSITAEGLDAGTGCVAVLDSYEVVVVQDPDAPSGTVVIVDPGEPIIGSSEMISLVSLVKKAQQPDLDATYIAFVPTDLVIPDQCIPVDPLVLPDDCDLSEIAKTHFDDYAVAVDEASLWFDSTTNFQLLASSFGAARWESVLKGPDPITIDNAVFVSPFTGGLSDSDLTDGLTGAARVIFQKVIDGCVSPDCFDSFGNPVEPESCPGFTCRPDETIAEIAGVLQEEALLGMYGLMPVADLDAPLIFEAIDNEDTEQLRTFLVRGRASILGLDSLDLISESQIHLLSIVCSVIESDPRGLFAECESVETRPEFLATRTLVYSETNLPDSCFYSAQPDPVLGYAATTGARFGDSMVSYTESLRRFVHGDLELGASRLAELITTSQCPSPAEP